MAANPANLWADVNDVIGAFAARRDDPRYPGPQLLAMLAAHRIDGPAALELTERDMYGSLGIRTADQREVMHDVIDEMRRRALEDLGLPADGVADEGDCDAVDEAPGGDGPGGSPPSGGSGSSDGNASAAGDDDDDDDDNDDGDLPGPEDFTFIEEALRSRANADGSDDPALRLQAAKLERLRAVEGDRGGKRSYAPRRIPPRELLSDALGSTDI